MSIKCNTTQNNCYNECNTLWDMKPIHEWIKTNMNTHDKIRLTFWHVLIFAYVWLLQKNVKPLFAAHTKQKLANSFENNYCHLLVIKTYHKSVPTVSNTDVKILFLQVGVPKN